jgi:hypothetical protein
LSISDIDWVKCPEWDEDDPLKTEKTYCWHILADARKKSVMSNGWQGNLSRGSTAVTYRMLRDFASARYWIMDMRDQSMIPKDERDLSIGCGFCLTALGISRDAFISHLKAVWRRHDKDIEEGIRSFVKRNREALRREKRASKGRKWRLGSNLLAATKAEDARKTSNNWLRRQ